MRKNASLFLRHSGLCLGYHDSHERIGIPQPPRLDPLCGVASMAVCLRALGMGYGKSQAVAAVPHHGMGSSLADLFQASRRLGLSPHAVSAGRDKGLIALPKPLVAHVEHDHFVAVVDADAKGVEYVCSDCGAWPGGPVRLTWKQWSAMETDAYLAVSKPGSVADVALTALERGQKPKDFGLVASLGGPAIKNAAQGAAVRNLLGALEAGMVAQTSNPGMPTVTCGQHPDSNKCIPCAMAAAMAQSGGTGNPSAPSNGGPVNLATAEEQYAPTVDLTVYNPRGPSVAWGHVYSSLSRYSSGFGEGWTHAYYRGVELTSSYSSLAGSVMFPDGARMAFSSAKPTATTQHVVCSLGAGMPYLLSADYDAATGGCTFTLTDESRTQWTTLAVGYPNDCMRGSTIYPLAKQTDRMGNWISFSYGTYHPVWVSGIAGPTVYRLSKISDSTGTALLTVGMDSAGWIVSATDRYGRSVYYQAADHTGVPPYTPPPYWYQVPHHLLDAVSQIVATGANNPPMRYQYGYQDGPSEPQESTPYLASVGVPSPVGTGISTMGLRFTADNGLISKVFDGNNKITQYTFAFTNGQSTAETGVDDGPEGGTSPPSGPPPFPGATVTILDGNTVVQKYGLISDMNMNPTKLVDASGATVWTKSYASSATPYRPSSVTDGNGRMWQYTWDPYGHLLTATTPKGTLTTCTYDYSHFALGELVSVKEGTKTATAVTYYQPSGLIQDVATPIPGEVATGNTQTTSYTYTALGNLASVVSPGNNTIANHTAYYNYTTDGAYTQAEALGEPIVVTDGNGKKWHRRYDARGNFIEGWDPLGNQTDLYPNLADQVVTSLIPGTGSTGTMRSGTTTTYLYTGGPATQVDARNENGTIVRTTNVTYGKEGETLTRTGSAETVSMTYDAAYHAKTLVDGNGHTTQYAYDLNGRPTRIDYPLASGPNADRLQFTAYDAVGNLLSRTDGKGQATNYSYGDTDGLLSAIAYPGASAGNVALAYDAYGRETSVTDGAGVETTAYDDEDGVVSTVTTYTGLPAKTLAYTYYPDGARHTMTNPAGTWSYGYDAAARYTTMVSPAGTSSATYLDNGWQSSRTLPNGVSTGYGYNAVGALTGQLNATSGSTTLSQYGSFTYDGVFNLTGMTASLPGVSSLSGASTYAYDTKDRLTGESHPNFAAATHAYDGAGNPTTLRGTAQSFDNDNRHTGSGFAYDGNGSPTTYRGTSLSYDREARATSIGGLTAGYRSDGLRAWKSYLGTKTYFLYDGGEPVAELDTFGNVVSTNVYAPDGLVARSTSSGTTQYAFDPEGNVAQRLDATGSVLTSSGYDGYGAEVKAGTAIDPFAYHARDGYYRDETGLYYCQNRYYDAGTGRWVTRDPIGYDGGINLYGYCGSGPVGASDPWGLNAADDRNEELRRGDRWHDKGIAGEGNYYYWETEDGQIHTHWPGEPEPGPSARPGGGGSLGTPRKKKPAKLRSEWEQMFGCEWPTESDGSNLIAHHSTPLADGGEDDGSNIMPVNKSSHKELHPREQRSEWGRRSQARRGRSRYEQWQRGELDGEFPGDH